MAAAVLSSVSCQDPVEPETTVTSVTLDRTALTLTEGETATLTATVDPAGPVTWTTSDSAVAAVDPNGKVTAVRPGTATVTATCSGKSATCQVTVEKKTVPVTALLLEPSAMMVTEKSSVSLTVTVEPSNTTERAILWSSADEAVATVDDKGKVTGIKAGNTSITVTCGGMSAVCEVTVVARVSDQPVDLGLSVRWMSRNLGANSPEESGNFYAWGETNTKSDYTPETYQWPSEAGTGYSAYNKEDQRMRLESADDIAYLKLGEDRRLPTEAELQELLDGCTAEWIPLNGVPGMKFTGKKPGFTDAWIFFPAAGNRVGADLFNDGERGYCWSSSLNPDNVYGAFRLSFQASGARIESYDRCSGQSVRAVSDPNMIFPSSVSVEPSSLSLFADESQILTATVLPEDAWDKSVTWKSSDTEIVFAGVNGGVLAIQSGSAIVTVTTKVGGKTAECLVTVQEHEPEAVDLGLGVLWASWNLGASSPEEFGDYFAWGETRTKYDFSKATYRWRETSTNVYAKYNDSDGKWILEPEDDAAHVKLGGKWRMPNMSEATDLYAYLNYEWTTLNGVEGMKFTNKSDPDKWIFLPASGQMQNTTFYGENHDWNGPGGYYWTSVLDTTPGYAGCAHRMYIDYKSMNPWGTTRFFGLTIRPVMDR